MLETKCVGDNFEMLMMRFSRFRHQHPLSFNINVGHHHRKDITNIKILSTTPPSMKSYVVCKFMTNWSSHVRLPKSKSYFLSFWKVFLYFIYNSDPDGAPNLAEAKRLAAIESNQSSEGFQKKISNSDWLSNKIQAYLKSD